MRVQKWVRGRNQRKRRSPFNKPRKVKDIKNKPKNPLIASIDENIEGKPQSLKPDNKPKKKKNGK